jgi:hypothetical protein
VSWETDDVVFEDAMDDGSEQSAHEGGPRVESTVSAEGGAHFTRRRLAFQQGRQGQQQVLENGLRIITAAGHADADTTLLMMCRFLFLLKRRENQNIFFISFHFYRLFIFFFCFFYGKVFEGCAD